MNSELLEKFRGIERTLSDRNGAPFRLFALLARRESASGWEVVVSAEWDHRDLYAVQAEVANEIQSRLTGQDLLSIARVFALDAASPEIEILTQNYRVRHQVETVQAVVIGNAIFDGYILASRRNEIAAQISQPSQTSDRNSLNDYRLSLGNGPHSPLNASVASNMIRETK